MIREPFVLHGGTSGAFIHRHWLLVVDCSTTKYSFALSRSITLIASRIVSFRQRQCSICPSDRWSANLLREVSGRQRTEPWATRSMDLLTFFSRVGQASMLAYFVREPARNFGSVFAPNRRKKTAPMSTQSIGLVANKKIDVFTSFHFSLITAGPWQFQPGFKLRDLLNAGSFATQPEQEFLCLRVMFDASRVEVIRHRTPQL